jgi:outer membrane lipoprotein carrier protein
LLLAIIGRQAVDKREYVIMIQAVQSPKKWMTILMVWVVMSQTAYADGVTVLRHYLHDLKTLQADFIQLVLNPGDDHLLESSGRFFIQRPGLFRWEYQQPSEQLIIADGQRIYLYDAELDQLSQRTQQDALVGTPISLLSDDLPLEQEFAVHNLDRADGRLWVELIPNASDAQIVKLQLGFYDDQLETVLMEDQFGQLTRFILSNIQRNQPLAAQLFRFEQPIGGEFLNFD